MECRFGMIEQDVINQQFGIIEWKKNTRWIFRATYKIELEIVITRIIVEDYWLLNKPMWACPYPIYGP